MLNKQTAAVILLAVIGFLSYLILKPFLLAIIGASILAILFHPVYQLLLRFIKSRTVSALVTCVIAFVIVAIPLAFVGQALYVETSGIVKEIASQNVSSEQVVGTAQSFLDDVVLFIPGVDFIDFKEVSLSFFKSATNWLRLQAIALPTKALLFLLSIFLFYFLLRDGNQLVKWIYSGLPLTRREQQVIDSRLSTVTYAVVYGQIVTAIAQGLVAMLGYWYFGIDAPVLWGLVTMFFSLVPFVGTAIIWVPASIYLFVTGLSTTSWWMGIGLFVYGLIIINAVDNILRPIFIGATARMHSAIALLGVIGGISLLGFVGIFAGPLILSLFVTLYDIFIRKENDV